MLLFSAKISVWWRMYLLLYYMQYVMGWLLHPFFPACAYELRWLARIKIGRRVYEGKFLSYKNPKDFNEKLHWLNKYWPNPLITTCADKYAVRDYVKQCGCEVLLNELYGVFDRVKDVDFDVFPSQFVLKCTHGYGYNIICRDKQALDISRTRKKMQAWMATDYAEKSGERQYHGIAPRIICERYLETSPHEALIDYKIHCFNGNPTCCLVCAERSLVNHAPAYKAVYSLEWERLHFYRKEKEGDIPKPDSLPDMIAYARKLSQPFPYVRVDFLYVEGQLFLSELTFTPAGNNQPYTDETLIQIGDKLVLPPKYSAGRTW
jgi:hypothetical protein